MAATMSSTPANARFDPQASARLAALINPLSFRMSIRDRAHRSAERVRAHGGEAFEVTDPARIERALVQALEQSVSRLVIAGGDGTLQAAVSYLAERLAPEHFPDLIVLGAGRTNYVAGDVGTRRDFPGTLERILAASPEQLHRVERSTLRLEHPSIGVQHGFFMAGAAIDEVIRYVHRWQDSRKTWLHRANLASGTGVIALGLRWAARRQHFDAPRLIIETDHLGQLDAPCRFLLATTLDHRGSLVSPYAARGTGALRLTAVRARAERLPVRLASLLRGRFNNRMTTENGYLSGNCEKILIRNIRSITLDGQEFNLDPATPLRISTGPVFRFLRP